MRVLVLGANGFIGSAVTAALLRAGLQVTAAVRDPEKLARRFPGLDATAVDLLDPAVHRPDHWRNALDGVDGVVNVAGVLQPRRERDAWAVHLLAVEALYAACTHAAARRIIHVSAIGVEEAETVFARSKRAGEQALMARELDWTILRPPIVFGDGSHGGTSMLRAIAAFPWVTPVIGDGETRLDFIHKDDLAAGIVALLQSGDAVRAVLAPASRERMTLADAVRAHRDWLGLTPRPVVRVPPMWVKALARVGDVVKLDPITTTAVAQFEARLTGEPEAFERATGVRGRGLSAALAERPAEVQDLWHARLYLLRPLVRLALALLWLVSGVLGLTTDPARFAAVLEPITSSLATAGAMASIMGLVDLAIAGALIAGWRLRELAVVQLVLVIGYTATLSVMAPFLWGDPFGALLKNIPIIALIAVHRVLEQER